MSVPFTDPATIEMLNSKVIADEIERAYRERALFTLGDSGNPEDADTSDFIVNDIDMWARWQNIGSPWYPYIEHGIGYGSSKWVEFEILEATSDSFTSYPDDYEMTLKRAFELAGRTQTHFRAYTEHPDEGGVPEYRYAEKGDIIGSWLWEDLQAYYSAYNSIKVNKAFFVKDSGQYECQIGRVRRWPVSCADPYDLYTELTIRLNNMSPSLCGSNHSEGTCGGPDIEWKYKEYTTCGDSGTHTFANSIVNGGGIGSKEGYTCMESLPIDRLDSMSFALSGGYTPNFNALGYTINGAPIVSGTYYKELFGPISAGTTVFGNKYGDKNECIVPPDTTYAGWSINNVDYVEKYDFTNSNI